MSFSLYVVHIDVFSFLSSFFLLSFNDFLGSVKEEEGVRGSLSIWTRASTLPIYTEREKIYLTTVI
jgi:hypothetical protein